VALKHVSMRAEVYFDAATGGRQTSISPVVVAKEGQGLPEGYPGPMLLMDRGQARRPRLEDFRVLLTHSGE
jgi:hypothetical protein